MTPVKKPPLGLEPKWRHDYQRFLEVREAISRYYNANLIIPVAWITEYNELLTAIKRDNPELLKEVGE